MFEKATCIALGFVLGVGFHAILHPILAHAQTEPLDDVAVTAAGDACNEPGHLRAVPQLDRTTVPPTLRKWYPGWEACETIMPAYNNTKKKLAEQAKVKAEQDNLDSVNRLANQLKNNQ